MNYIKTLVALIVLACLGYYAHTLSQMPEETADSKKVALVSGFEFDGLTDIQIKRSYDTYPIEFSRANVNADWMMQKPFNSLADQTTVNDLANDVKLAKADSVISAAEVSKPENFGLGTNSISLIFKSGTREIVLNYGKKNPEGNLCYVTVGSEKDVKLAESKLFDALVKKVNDYRDKKVCVYDPSSIKWFEISCPKSGGPVMRFKKDQYTWYFDSPVKGRCNSSGIEEIIKSIPNILTKGFIEPTENDFAANNVSEGSAELLMRFGTGGTSEVTNVVAFGAEKQSENTFCYVKSSYKKELLYVEKGVREQTKNKYREGFGPVKCLDFETANANRIVMIPGDTVSTELKKISSDWKYDKQGTQSVQVNADSPKIEGFLQKIRDCKIMSISSGDTTNVELLNDFKKPALELRLGLNFSDRTEAVFLVPANYAKHPYVIGDEKEKIYEVKRETLDDILLSVKNITENKK